MAWLAEQTLVKNGNSSALNVPKEFMRVLGWITGRRLIIELDDVNEQLIVRKPTLEDLNGVRAPRAVQTGVLVKP
jgi:antitoxin component of MazEF toxin-antitoxin module